MCIFLIVYLIYDSTIIFKNKDIGKFNELVKIDRQQSKQQPIENEESCFPADIWIRQISRKDAKRLRLQC